MTSENRWLFSLDEINAIRFQCKNCGAVKAFSLNRWTKITRICENCPHQWLEAGSVEEEAMRLFNQALADFVKVINLLGCSVSIEVPSPIYAEPRKVKRK